MKSKKIYILSILVILLILIKGYLFSTKYVSDNSQKEYTIFIESLKVKSETKVIYNVKLLNTSDKFILNIYDNSYDNIQTDLTEYSNYKYGDVIKVKGKISIPQKLNNPGEFDYKQYLYSNNIHGLINTYETPIKIEHQMNVIENICSKIYMFKDYVQNIINKSMDETNANVAISMIYGDTTNLDESIQEDFEAIGVSHLMSVSGTHITSFMIIINTVLGIKKSNKSRRKNSRKYNQNKRNKEKDNKKTYIIKCVIQILSICIYMFFTGFGISVVRAGIMLVISIVCDMLDKKKNKYQALAITFLVILLQNPYVIFNTGARLSFLATLGIILFGKHIANGLKKVTYKIKNEVIQKVVEYITQNIAITIAVQLLIIPIQMQAFNKLPFPVIVPNLILGMLSTPIRIVGTIGIMLSFIPMLSCKIFSALELVVKALVYIAKIFKNISFSISTVSQPLVFFVIYYIFILTLVIYLRLKNVIVKEGKDKLKYNFKRLLKYLKIFQITLVIIIITMVVTLNIYSVYVSEYVYFFNVEQGDMSYIKSGKESVIVDIGSLSNTLAFNTISNYFKTSNLAKVDAAVISHMHKDHINGLEKLLKNYDVGIVLYSKPKEDSEAYQNFKQILNKYNVNSKQVKAGDDINIGKIKIQVLLPDNEYINSTDDVNANSLVCKITVNNKELLYMGDASIDSEEKLIEKYTKNTKENVKLDNIYILKVGHHGSKTATSEEFIQKIQPQNAVISALKKYYGHPHENTTDTLKQNNVYTYLTEKQGAIKFSLK